MPYFIFYSKLVSYLQQLLIRNTSMTVNICLFLTPVGSLPITIGYLTIKWCCWGPIACWNDWARFKLKIFLFWNLLEYHMIDDEWNEWWKKINWVGRIVEWTDQQLSIIIVLNKVEIILNEFGFVLKCLWEYFVLVQQMKIMVYVTPLTSWNM